MRHALSVTPECVPLIKTGGLADVAGALPGAMAAEGWHLTTLLPGYPKVLEAVKKSETVLAIPKLYGGAAAVRKAKVKGLDLLILDAPHLYDRSGGPYLDQDGNDYGDNPERFAALSNVAAQIASGAIQDYRPEVLQCHDWQAGFAPYFAKTWGTGVPSIITIHNVAFQGVTGSDRIPGLGLDGGHFNAEGYEYWGNVSALKAGLVFADKITTVSPTYAHELATAEFGMGMDGVIRARRADMVGILNGIDTDVWNPETDPEIETYKSLKGKAKAKKALLEEFGLEKTRGPLFVVISRLSHQKGLDLLLQALETLVVRDAQLILLGSGAGELEHAYRSVSQHPNIASYIGYDEAMSHRIMAGGDAVLVPSRFEPCGLTQLMGLRYGTVPVVARTGGLVDTVIDASPMALRAGVATGVQFGPLTAHALAGAVSRTCDLYSQPKVWEKIQKNGMKAEVGWSTAAAEYANLYAEVAGAA